MTMRSPPRNPSAQATWASFYVAKAEALGLDLFTPDRNVHEAATRGEVIQIILKVMGIPTGSKTADYRDVSEDHPYPMKPEKVFRIGPVSASVFRNEIKTEGGTKAVRNVNLQRRYKDGDEWKSTSSFGLADLPQALAVLELAMKHLAAEEAEVAGG